MNRIVLKEDFSLVEAYDMLLESRGVIDGVDGIVGVIYNYVCAVLKDEALRKKYYVGHSKRDKVEKFQFTVPSNLFFNVDCLFMERPVFTIQLFVMDSVYGDEDRHLGDCYYSSLYRPQICLIDGQKKLFEPKFLLSFVLKPNTEPDINIIGAKVSHEIVHAKKNFVEYITMSRKREGLFNRDRISLELLTHGEENMIEKLVGRILYLCSKDEINARVNQLYFELKRFKMLNRTNINKAVEKTSVYSFIEEFDKKKEELFCFERQEKVKVKEKIGELLKTVYQKGKFADPYKFLYNLLINRKNYFIRQVDKVKERVLYELTLIPLKK